SSGNQQSVASRSNFGVADIGANGRQVMPSLSNQVDGGPSGSPSVNSRVPNRWNQGKNKRTLSCLICQEGGFTLSSFS
ncbi:hypothetical protein PMAYCL1PPCAC_26378, partial [Pristionchus mayeri]